MDQNQNQRERKQINWTDCADFKENVGSVELIVRVSKSSEFVPKYSIKVGRLLQDGSGSNNIPISTQGQGRVDITRVGAVLAKLIKDAEDYIHNEAQYREDEVIEVRQAREQRGVKKIAEPKGLGALGKMDAAKRAVPPTTESK